MTKPRLDAALAYAERGWPVFPLRPGKKTPATDNGFLNATTDPDLIRSWWQRHPHAGIGIATGAAAGLWVLDIDVKPELNVNGFDTLADLEEQHGRLPDTLTQLTPNGGEHRVFAWPATHDIRNSQSGRIGAGLDVRGDGGYICAEPTTLDNGNAYEWDLGTDEIAEAPRWLLDLVAPPAPAHDPAPQRATNDVGDRPGDRWAAATDWADILGPDGWTLVSTHGTERRWCRPGKDPQEGPSATTGHSVADNLKVFSSSVRDLGLEPDEHYTKLGYLAATRHHGNLADAAAALAEAGWGEERPDPDALGLTSISRGNLIEIPPRPTDSGSGTSWQPVDLATVSTDPITPEFLFRSDRHALIYPGRISWISAEPEAGKTWIALVAVKQAIESGRRVLVLDYEDSPAGFLERCEALSIKAVQAQADRLLRYIAPSEPLSSGNRATLGAVAFADTIEWKPELVILDACTASMANEGLDPNGNVDIAAWLNIAVKPLTRAGAAVLVIDHVTKSREGRERWAIGGQHKLAAVDGAAFSVEAIRPFGRAYSEPVHGLSRLTLQKDRPGYLRGLTSGTKAAPIADFAVTAWPDGGVTAQLEVPGQGGIDEHQQRVVERLAVYDGETKTSLRSLGNSDSMDAALTALVSAGHVRIERKGASHLHFLTTAGRIFWAELLDSDLESAA